MQFSLVAMAFAPLVAACALVLIVILVILRMRPRRFYFVRHGETILNAQHIRQSAEGGLSPLGRSQADAVGRYLTQLPIQTIIASPYERTRETAAIINGYLNVPISYCELFTERRNPSEIIGKSQKDPEVRRITDAIDGSYHDDTYRFSDEENFQDLKDRARKALEFLANTSTRETCVVTHGIFLKMLISYLLHREGLHASEYVKFSFFNAASNAGITICEYHPWRRRNATRGWEVITYDATLPQPRQLTPPPSSSAPQGAEEPGPNEVDS